MKSYLPTATLISVALLVAACQPIAAQPDPPAEAAKQAEDVAAIKRMNADRRAAFDARDAAAFAAFFTDDAIHMPPNAPAFIGKEAIQLRYQTAFDRRAASKFTFASTADAVEFEVAGDWAFMRTADTITRTPKAGGEPIEFNGKDLYILKRQPDGAWKIYLDIWNNDKPRPSRGQ